MDIDLIQTTKDNITESINGSLTSVLTLLAKSFKDVALEYVDYLNLCKKINQYLDDRYSYFAKASALNEIDFEGFRQYATGNLIESFKQYIYNSAAPISSLSEKSLVSNALSASHAVSSQSKAYVIGMLNDILAIIMCQHTSKLSGKDQLVISIINRLAKENLDTQTEQLRQIIEETIEKQFNTQLDNFTNLLEKIKAARMRPSNDLFHHTCPRLPNAFGRTEELIQLSEFLHDEKSFLFWAITGPTGVGKSKLAYVFSQNLKDVNDWSVFFLSKEETEAISKLSDWHYDKNLFLIIDSANEAADTIAVWLQNMYLHACYSVAKKMRILLIAREGIHVTSSELPPWCKRILITSQSDGQIDSTMAKCLYSDKLLELSGIPIHKCGELIDAFYLASIGKICSLDEKQEIEDFLRHSISATGEFIEPLWVLFTVQAYISDGKLNSWNKGDLLQKVYDKDITEWKKSINDDKAFPLLIRTLIYSTIMGEWNPDKDAPDIIAEEQKELSEIAELHSKETFCSWFTILSGHFIEYKEEFGTPEYALPNLMPDIVGEYFVIRRFKDMTKQVREKWLKYLATHSKQSNDFWIRTVQNFSTDEKYGDMVLGWIEKQIDYLLPHDIENFNKLAETIFYVLSYLCGLPDKSYYDRFSDHIRSTINKLSISNQSWAEIRVKYLLSYIPQHTLSRKRGRYLHVQKLLDIWPDSDIIREEHLLYLGDLAANDLTTKGAKAHSSKYLELIDRNYSYTETKNIVLKETMVSISLKVAAAAYISMHTLDIAKKYLGIAEKIIKENKSNTDLLVLYIDKILGVFQNQAKYSDGSTLLGTIASLKEIIQSLKLDTGYHDYGLWTAFHRIVQIIVLLCYYDYEKEAVDLSQFFVQLERDYLESTGCDENHRMHYGNIERATDPIFKQNFPSAAVRAVFLTRSPHWP